MPDAAAAAELVPGLLRAGDVVLVKGSRGGRARARVPGAQGVRAGRDGAGAGV